MKTPPSLRKTPRASRRGSDWARGPPGAGLRVSLTQGILSRDLKALSSRLQEVCPPITGEKTEAWRRQRQAPTRTS